MRNGLFVPVQRTGRARGHVAAASGDGRQMPTFGARESAPRALAAGVAMRAATSATNRTAMNLLMGVIHHSRAKTELVGG
jgi:hypothetical protein